MSKALVLYGSQTANTNNKNIRTLTCADMLSTKRIFKYTHKTLMKTCQLLEVGHCRLSIASYPQHTEF